MALKLLLSIGRNYVNQAYDKVKSMSKKELEDEEKTILKELLINKDKYKTDLNETLSFMVDMLGGAIETVFNFKYIFLFH